MKIKTVTVVGANGIMGSNVSGMFASFGDAKVFLISRDLHKSQVAAQKAATSVRADSVLKNLVPLDYSSLDACVAQSDLIFESVFENLETKKEAMAKIAATLPEHAVVATGTSGLSVTELSEVFAPSQRSRVFGVHFFNPPYNMTLCELTATEYSDYEIRKELIDYLSNTLFRTVVQTKDSPAFLGNRIGFHFLNRVMQYAESYQDKGGIDYIDALLGSFTGRSMAPLATVDFVGLDVHKAIVNNLSKNTNDFANDDFTLPEFAQNLIKEGKFGRKSKEGLYKLQKLGEGHKEVLVYDIAGHTYRKRIEYRFPFAEQMIESLQVGKYQDALRKLLINHSDEAKLSLSMLLDYIAYSLYAAKEVAFSVHDADRVMAAGFSWCPPLALVDAFSLLTDFDSLLQSHLSKPYLDAVNQNQLIDSIEKSHYDYRPYFKASY